MVLIIALIPALLIYGVSRYTQSKSATYLAALGAGALGIFTGNPIYTGVDLLFVSIATYISIAELTADIKRQQASFEQERAAESLRSFLKRTGTDIDEGYTAKAAVLAMPPERRKALRDAARAKIAAQAAASAQKAARIAVDDKRTAGEP